MSQFTIYKSTDGSAPSLYGTTGSLISLLDACLVTGYGTKTAVGWTKPLPNTGSITFSQSYGCYQQPTGSGMTLFINDNAPNGSALFREAWATGWEVLLNLSSSVSNSCGSGSGQFPTPAQLFTGSVTIRKSNTSDATTKRDWVVLADSSSFYLLILTGDVASTYYGFGFGDIYSFKSTTDQYKCIIMGRNAVNSSAAANDGFDLFSSTINTATVGNFMARSYTGGLGGSITTSKHGDGIKGSINTYSGSIPFPNGTDAAFYVSPVWVVETGVITIRGQLRGLYQPLHPAASFIDGQAFNGSLDLL